MRLACAFPTVGILMVVCACACLNLPAAMAQVAEKPVVENQNPADEVPLPARDAQIQNWMTELAGIGKAQSESERVAVAEAALTALYQNKFTKSQWVRQIIVFLSSLNVEGEEAWGRELMLLDYSKRYLRISASEFGFALGPLLGSKDRRTAYIAGDMLDYCGILDCDLDLSGAEAYNVPNFRAMGSYIDGCKPGDPSWIIIGRMYDRDPNAALNSARAYYFSGAGDRDTSNQLRKAILEMTMLRLSHDLASDEDTPQWDRKITARLAELAGHPHWTVRVYALVVVQKGSRPFGKQNAWATQTDIPAKLADDSNPLVSQWAKALRDRN